MIKSSRDFQSTLKRRIKKTSSGKLVFFKRTRIKNCSFSYPKKKSKRLFLQKTNIIVNALRNHKHYKNLIKK